MVKSSNGATISSEPFLKSKIVPWSPLYDLVFKTDTDVFDDIMLSMKYIKNLRMNKGEMNKKLLNTNRKRNPFVRKMSRIGRGMTRASILFSK